MQPEAEELSPAELRELETDLRALLAELDSNLAEQSEATSTVDLDQPIGRISRIDALQQQKMAKEQRRRAELRRSQIRQALVWIDEDEYGFCNRCEEPIGFPRLKARPESAFCVACRSSFEGRGR